MRKCGLPSLTVGELNRSVIFFCLFVFFCSKVSLENVLLDVRELGKGMELIRRECSLHDHSVLKGFVQASDAQLDKLQKDAKTAEVPQAQLLQLQGAEKNRRGASRLPALRPLCFLTRDSPVFSPDFQEAFNNVVNYFGESAKTAPPSVFFPVFVRFVKAYKVSDRQVLCSSRLLSCHGFGLLVVGQPASEEQSAGRRRRAAGRGQRGSK